MKLRKLARLCEHDQLGPHPVGEVGEFRCIHWPGEHVAACGTSRWVVLEPGIPCPGGVFLPDDTLADAAWQFNEAVSLLREVRGSVMVPADVHAIDEGLPAMQSALKALATLVQEPIRLPGLIGQSLSGDGKPTPASGKQRTDIPRWIGRPRSKS